MYRRFVTGASKYRGKAWLRNTLTAGKAFTDLPTKNYSHWSSYKTALEMTAKDMWDAVMGTSWWAKAGLLWECVGSNAEAQANQPYLFALAMVLVQPKLLYGMNMWK